MPPKVSVVIPVYNVSKQLEKCLDSVVAQTFPDIEIIVVNDSGSLRFGLLFSIDGILSQLLVGLLLSA